MKKLIAVMAVMAVVVAVAFGAALAAEAEQCSLLIKQLTERVAKLSDHNYKKERAQRLITEAQKLYDEGKPADCVKKCAETTTSLN